MKEKKTGSNKIALDGIIADYISMFSVIGHLIITELNILSNIVEKTFKNSTDKEIISLQHYPICLNVKPIILARHMYSYNI